MGYTDDWEKLMNGAFGSNGKPNFSAGTTKGTAGGGSVKMTDGTELTLDTGKAGNNGAQASDPAKAGRSSFDLSHLDELTRALQEQQRTLTEKLKAQNTAIRASDNATEKALADSRAMIQDMEADGLLAEGTSEVDPKLQGTFEGLADVVKKQVLGQDAFVDSFVRAMRRPFVLGTEAPRARNVILATGSEGTGRHYTLRCIAKEMAARGLISSDALATMDLSLYGNPGAEKLFLQDLYGALHAQGSILVFENYEACHPGFLKVLSDLAVKGSAPLTSRYLVKDGILVDAGTALVPGAVGSLTPCGKYMIFFSEKGRDHIADKFGAGMVGAIGDVCQTGAFTTDSLSALAAQQINTLAQKVSKQLSMTLTAGADVRDWVASKCSKSCGSAGLSNACDKLFRALSEYCLNSDAPTAKAVSITIKDDAPYYSADGSEPRRLFDLLPAEYTGAIEAVQKEMDEIVGLKDLKQYVLDLADNVRVQQRRAAAGMKTANLSMHMIFTGNPGTGKTTIARIVSRYLKAIGALSGGQLIEVSRGDLVGRYSGHTAPLTNSVIQSALGGVLFIDEAYSLYRGEQDSFGLEAIDTLVKGMEDHRDELVVILAGYTKEMEEFLTANSGLASRFPNRIEFPDYSGEELLEITKCLCKSKGYKLETDCDMPLLAYYNEQQATNAAKAGNGRLARNTLEKAILNQGRRLVAEPEAPLDVLVRKDFDLGVSDADAAAEKASNETAAQTAAPEDEDSAPEQPAEPEASAPAPKKKHWFQ
jgi:hypothetical protein